MKIEDLTICPAWMDCFIAKKNASNDGLMVSDWLNWFSNYNVNDPLAVIQFTKFRYQHNRKER